MEAASRRRLSRREEKAELGRLNDRLAAYIEQVRALEAHNGRLLLRVSHREDDELRQARPGARGKEARRLQAQLAAATQGQAQARALSEQAAELRAQTQLLQDSLKKKEGECVAGRSRAQELEGRLRRSEGELSAALARERDLEAEAAALRTRLDKSEEAHGVAKRQLEAETLLRVDLENRNMSLREEMDFQKALFEQEVREVRQRHLVEEPGPAQRLQEQQGVPLAVALEELRGQHQAQVELYRAELEQAYRAKLESAKLSSDQSGKVAGAAQEELGEARLRIQALTAQLSALQAQANAAEERQREAEGRLAGEREAFRAALEAKEREAQEAREERQRQRDQFQELLGVKMALDMEIRAYRTLLEGEEERLKLSPSPPRITVSRATSSSSSPLWGKRKRREAQEPLSSETSPTSGAFQLGLAQGSVSIEEVDPHGRFVRLRNRSQEDQPLGNWRLKKAMAVAEGRGEAGEGEEEEAAASTAYKFGPRFVLRAGQSVTVWSCDAGVSPRPPSSLVWKGHRSRPWGPGANARLALLDARGEEVAARSLSPEEEEVEEEQALGEEDLFHQQGDPRTTSKGCAVM